MKIKAVSKVISSKRDIKYTHKISINLLVVPAHVGREGKSADQQSTGFMIWGP